MCLKVNVGQLSEAVAQGPACADGEPHRASPSLSRSTVVAIGSADRPKSERESRVRNVKQAFV